MNLQYFWVSNINASGNEDAHIQGSIDNVQIWDGVTDHTPYVYEVVAGGDFEAGKLSNALVDPTLTIESGVLPSSTDDFTIMGWVKSDPVQRYSAESTTTVTVALPDSIGSAGDLTVVEGDGFLTVGVEGKLGYAWEMDGTDEGSGQTYGIFIDGVPSGIPVGSSARTNSMWVYMDDMPDWTQFLNWGTSSPMQRWFSTAYQNDYIATSLYSQGDCISSDPIPVSYTHLTLPTILLV